MLSLKPNPPLSPAATRSGLATSKSYVLARASPKFDCCGREKMDAAHRPAQIYRTQTLKTLLQLGSDRSTVDRFGVTSAADGRGAEVASA